MNRQHAKVFNKLEKLTGKLMQGDYWGLFELAYHSDGPILEIGGYRGKSTCCLAAGLNSADHGYYGLVTVEPRQYSRDALVHTVRSHYPTVALTVIPTTSDEAFKSIMCRVFDLIFIDGDHSESQVYKDIINAKQVLKPGGVIALHDYYHPANWDPENEHYGVDVAARRGLNDFRYVGRFGGTAVFQDFAHPESSVTVSRVPPELGALQPSSMFFNNDGHRPPAFEVIR